MQLDKAEAAKIVKILREEYPAGGVALTYKNPFQLLVATILSAQCTDKKVNEITPGLFKKYKNAADFAESSPEELEAIIKSSGFYRSKARNIIASSIIITDEYGGKAPDTMRELLRLPGVARKTANIVLSSAFKKAEGIAVDTHVKRLSGRLGLSGENAPDKIERDLMRLVPRSGWIDFNYLMVNHGRAVCIARAPRCAGCALSPHCGYYKQNPRGKL